MEPIFKFFFGGSALSIAMKVGAIVLIIVVLRFIYSYIQSYESRQKKNVLDRMIASGNYLQAGNVYQQEGKPLLALKMFTQGRHWDRAASVQESLGDPVKAAEMYEKGMDFESASKAYLKGKKYLEAARCMNLCDKEGLRTKAAELFESQKEFRKAVDIYRSLKMYDRAAGALREMGDERSSFELMGMHHAGLGQDLKAAESFARAGNHEEAARNYQAYVRKVPISRESVEHYYQLALALEKANRPMEAVEVFDQISKHNKNFRDALIRMNKIKRETMGVDAESVAAAVQASTKLQFQLPIHSTRYDIMREIGRGGMGVVYEAMDTALGRMVALKVLHESYASSPVAEKFFMREAQSAAKLNHPNIVTVYDVGTLDGRLFISMEYIDGTTFEDILEGRGRLPVEEFMPVAGQVLSAMAYAHARGVIHRDIKPGNIMLCGDQVKIMDFGLAKVMDEKQKTTVVAGTPQYMPIEQMAGKGIDHRVDIFALGVSFFEMLTNVLPYPDGVIAFPAEDRPAEVRALNPDIPMRLSKIIDRMIERKIEDRYPSIDEIERDFKSVVTYASPR
jgi:tetratricopeptide (TPR) repeat protein